MKIQKTHTKVFVTHSVHGYQAPNICVDAEGKNDNEKSANAVKQAQAKSGLSRFPEWVFTTHDPVFKRADGSILLRGINAQVLANKLREERKLS